MNTSEKVHFRGGKGHEIAAVLDRPPGPVRAWALFAHCFTCGKDLNSVRWISQGLNRAGYGVLRFDFTGIGESEGAFEETGFSSNLEDLRLAVSWMRENAGAPGVMIGHSLGGAAALVVAAETPELAAVATIGAPRESAHLEHLLKRVAPDLEERGEVEVSLGGRPFRVRKELLDDIAEDRVGDALKRLRKPLAIFHSPTDEIVGIDNARRIYEEAHHPKSFVSLDGADHLLLRDAKDARFVAGLLASWAERYLPEPAESGDEDGAVVVRGGPRKFAQRVQVGTHDLVADEPAAMGGTGQGPSPYEFLLSGLGACTSMTIQLYAERKRWPLEGTEVRLRHRKETAAADGQPTDHFEREITLLGPLDDEQRARLLEIANKCPVHRTLHDHAVVETRERRPSS